MGNNIGGGGNSKYAKIMKINGDYFKIKTPFKVIDIIKDYPNHILLDSQDFLLYNLRAKPLELDFELKPKRIYLLFELPKFPQEKENSNNTSSLRRVRSNNNARRTVDESRMLMLKRSISDLSKSINDRIDDENVVLGHTTRVKVKLPKVEVKRILEESNDDVEVAQRILKLLTTADGGDAVVEAVVDGGGDGGGGRENVVVVVEDEEDMEGGVVDKHCFNIYSICGSNSQQRNKYMKLSPK